MAANYSEINKFIEEELQKLISRLKNISAEQQPAIKQQALIFSVQQNLDRFLNIFKDSNAFLEKHQSVVNLIKDSINISLNRLEPLVKNEQAALQEANRLSAVKDSIMANNHEDLLPASHFNQLTPAQQDYAVTMIDKINREAATETEKILLGVYKEIAALKTNNIPSISSNAYALMSSPSTDDITNKIIQLKIQAKNINDASYTTTDDFEKYTVLHETKQKLESLLKESNLGKSYGHIIDSIKNDISAVEKRLNENISRTFMLATDDSIINKLNELTEYAQKVNKYESSTSAEKYALLLNIKQDIHSFLGKDLKNIDYTFSGKTLKNIDYNALEKHKDLINTTESTIQGYIDALIPDVINYRAKLLFEEQGYADLLNKDNNDIKELLLKKDYVGVLKATNYLTAGCNNSQLHLINSIQSLQESLDGEKSQDSQHSSPKLR